MSEEHDKVAQDKLREAHHALREALAAARLAGWGNITREMVQAIQQLQAIRSEVT